MNCRKILVSNKLKERLREMHHFRYIVLLLFVCIFALCPFLSSGYILGHDSIYHISSVDSLKWGGESSRIIDNFAGNYGYGQGIFYPQLGHYVASFFKGIMSPFGVSTFTSIKITYFLLLFLSGVFMYYLVFKLTKNKTYSIISSIVYMVSPYHLSDILIRDALAEVCFFTFLPLIPLGLYYLSKEEFVKFFPIFIVGSICLINSHFVLTMWAVIIFLIICIMQWRIFLSKKKIINLAAALLTILAIVLPGIIPLLEHKFSNVNYVVFDTDYMTNRSFSSLPIFSIFSPLYSLDGIVFAINIVVCGACFLAFNRLHDYSSQNRKRFLICLLFSILCFCLMTFGPSWKNFPEIVKMIQFRWRLCLFGCFFISVMFGIALLAFSKREALYLIFATMICNVIFANYVYKNTSISTSIDRSNFSTITYEYKEYLPVKAAKSIDYLKEKENSISVISGDARISDYKSNMPSLSFDVEIDGKEAILELPRYYYLGYDIKSCDRGASSCGNLKYEESKHGLLKITIKKDTHIVIEYNGTFLIKIFKIIAVIVGLLSGFLYCYFYKNSLSQKFTMYCREKISR